MGSLKDLTKRVKEANDIVAVIGAYVSSLRPTGNGHQFKGLCPFHSDHRPSFQVDAKFQNYRCWSCGKFGDVFTFIQEQERVSFMEARAILARRANIALEENDAENLARLQHLEAIRWAAEQFHQCLLESPQAQAARAYLGERQLLGETVRKFGLGYAPISGDWLVERIKQTNVPMSAFADVGLVRPSQSGDGFYSPFRDRVMFPIRDSQGKTVGFGGRVLPGSTLAERGPKYYNSAETPLFSKSELLYGLDEARHAAANAGYLAIVEGYTDVLMAHQFGIKQVVATMGTALNARHIKQLRRFVTRVVLVFDADEGGNTGVDRALEIFASHDIELAIASLPDGLDPCDLLVQRGPEPFREALAKAPEALDFKLNQLLEREAGNGIAGQGRVIDSVLNIIAAAPAGAARMQITHDLFVGRIARRLGIRDELVRTRLQELRTMRREPQERGPLPDASPVAERRAGPAPAHECELMKLLLANPEFVEKAIGKIASEEITHPGLRQIVDGLYTLQQEGLTPDLDELRMRMEHGPLIVKAIELMEEGRQSTADRNVWFEQIVDAFREPRSREQREQLKNQLTAASDYETEMALLRRLQGHVAGTDR